MTIEKCWDLGHKLIRVKLTRDGNFVQWKCLTCERLLSGQEDGRGK